jgi:cell division transport system ATP-binding protein
MRHVLKLVGLSHQENLFPSQLSGGEMQRVSLARALAVNPRILLADEPTGNLDWDTSSAMMDLFEKINKEGKTIIMATHNQEIVKKHKKRIIHIVGGMIKHNV